MPPTEAVRACPTALPPLSARAPERRKRALILRLGVRRPRFFVLRTHAHGVACLHSLLLSASGEQELSGTHDGVTAAVGVTIGDSGGEGALCPPGPTSPLRKHCTFMRAVHMLGSTLLPSKHLLHCGPPHTSDWVRCAV